MTFGKTRKLNLYFDELLIFLPPQKIFNNKKFWTEIE